MYGLIIEPKRFDTTMAVLPCSESQSRFSFSYLTSHYTLSGAGAVNKLKRERVLKRKRLPAANRVEREAEQHVPALLLPMCVCVCGSGWIDEGRTKRNGRLGVKSLIGLMPSDRPGEKRTQQKEREEGKRKWYISKYRRPTLLIY